MKKTLILAFSACITLFASANDSYTKDELGHVVTTLPYQTSFDNTFKEYDGTSQLPIGWSCSGDSPFVTASSNEIPAADGTYYAISLTNTESPRNEKLYTVFFTMEAGKEYTISYQLWMPGYYGDFIDGEGWGYSELRHPEHFLTIGKEQDFEFHTLLASEMEPSSGWKKIEVKYIPETTDNYCFCFAFESADKYSGSVAIDDVCVKYKGGLLRPVVDFSYGGMFNLMDGTMVTTFDASQPFFAQAVHATNYDWKVVRGRDNKVVATSTEENPRFCFPESDDYTITLTASNDKYSTSKTRTVEVTSVGANESAYIPLQTYGKEDEVTKYYQSGTTPTLGTDYYDFVSGPNRFYHRFAERVVLPDGAKFKFDRLWYFICSATLASVTTGTVEREKPFTFTIYGEKDGLPDESNIIYQVNTKMGNAISTNAGGLGAPASMSQDFGCQVDGTFYIAFEYPDNLSISSDGQTGRTSVEMMANQHLDGRSTLYYFSELNQQWAKIDAFNEKLAGTGLQLILWGTLSVEGEEGIEAVLTTSASQMGCFDLQGRQTNSLQKGLNIVNGKKILFR